MTMASFSTSSSKSYLSSLFNSNSPSTYNSSTNDDEIRASDDVDVLRWKLYGKNEEFRIMHDAATTIQAFWRGCYSRTMTSVKIQKLIEDIVAFRKLEEEYKKRDEEEYQKLQRWRRVPNRDSEKVYGDTEGEHDDSYVTNNQGISRRNNQNKPWRISKEDHDRGHRITTLVTSPRKLSQAKKEGGGEERTNQASGFSESPDDGTRGYQRYRTNIHGKNKTRPWRDDTSVFDAY